MIFIHPIYGAPVDLLLLLLAIWFIADDFASGGLLVLRIVLWIAAVFVGLMALEGFFMPSGVPQEAVDFYVDLLKKVRATPDWKTFSEQAAFNQTFMTGPEYVKWVTDAEAKHRQLMEKAGFLASK